MSKETADKIIRILSLILIISSLIFVTNQINTLLNDVDEFTLTEVSEESASE